MTVERVTQIDETYLDLKGYNCMAVVSSSTYNGKALCLNLPSHGTGRTGSYSTIWLTG